MTLVVAWTIYTVVGVSLFSAVFVWAVRTRQFTELDRQSRIALATPEPLEQTAQARAVSRVDKLGLVIVALVAVAVIAAALWLGLGSGHERQIDGDRTGIWNSTRC